MQDELLTPGVAKLAKEKGFDWKPTQSLLQRWFRELHNIDVFCDCIGSRRYFSVIYDNNIKEGNDKVFEQENVEFYEASLEIGLEAALKLIK